VRAAVPGLERPALCEQLQGGRRGVLGAADLREQLHGGRRGLPGAAAIRDGRLQETEKIERRVNVVAPTHVGLSFLAPRTRVDRGIGRLQQRDPPGESDHFPNLNDPLVKFYFIRDIDMLNFSFANESDVLARIFIIEYSCTALLRHSLVRWKPM
jgi:hypothetical protein